MNLWSLIKLYKQFLDYLNITYSIAKVKKYGYKELNMFILFIKGLNVITKTMIFVDIINERIFVTKYLCIKLPNNLKTKQIRLEEFLLPIYQINQENWL